MNKSKTNPIKLFTNKLFSTINAILLLAIAIKIKSQGSEYFEYLDVDITKVILKVELILN